MKKHYIILPVLFLMSVRLCGQTFYHYATSFRVFDDSSKQEITYKQLQEGSYHLFFLNRSCCRPYEKHGYFMYDTKINKLK